MSSTNWIAVTVGLLGVALLLAVRGRPKSQDYGAVSDEWVAQHRSEPTLDPF